MNKSQYLLLAFCFATLLSGCASTRTEQFSDSFFTYENPEGQKYFSFILKLKGVASEKNDRFEPLPATPESRQRRQSRRQKKDVMMPENPEDANVSLKFRMEEKAHKMLLARLSSSNYCPNNVQYESETFERYQYKIKGFCLD